MSVEVKIKDADDAVKRIKNTFQKLKKLDKNFEKTDDDKSMQRKIEIQEKKQKQILGGTIRGFINFLQSEYPKEINHLLKKEQYITDSKSSLTAFEKRLIKSDPAEILKIFLDIFDLDESSTVKFKNDENGKELEKITTSLKKLDLNSLLDLILDDDDDKKDDKKETESRKVSNSTKSTLSDINEFVERILSTKVTPEKKAERLKKVIVIAKKSLGTSPKSKKISPLLDSIDKKLDSIKSDAAITKIAGVLQKLLDKIG